MTLSRFFRSLKKNILLLLILIFAYGLLIVGSVTINSRPRPPVKVDVVFVFDTTGSMTDKFESLINTSSRFAQKLEESGADYTLGMVCFGGMDENEEPIHETYEPDDNLEDFQAFLSVVQICMGSVEDQPTALKYAMEEFDYRRKVENKIIILVTDEPLPDETVTRNQFPGCAFDWDDIVDDLKDDDFIVIAVCIPEEDGYQELVEETGGKFYDINSKRDFSAVLMNITRDIKSLIR